MHEGSLYGQSHLSLGQFFRLDPTNGKVIWLSDSRMGQYATFLTIPGYIFALKDEGVLDSFPSGKDNYDTITS